MRRLTSFGALALLFFAGCSRQEPPRSEIVRPVKTMIVAAEDTLDTRIFPGKVDAAKQAELAFQVPGVLISLPVKEGQSIAKGEIIAQLRRDEFQARLQTAQGQFDQAEAALDALRLGERPEEQIRRETQERAAAAKLANAKTEFERYARLVQSSAVSRSEYELAQTAYTVAQEEHQAAVQLLQKGTTARKEDIDAQEAVVRGLGGRVADARLQLQDSTLRAPYDGVIAQRFVEEGQSVALNRPVVRFQSAGAIDVVIDVPEAAIASGIRSPNIVGMVAEINGAPGRQYPVRIKEIAQVADPVTQTFPVRFEMRPPSGVTILPGMTATVTISRRHPSPGGNRIFVPISAVSKRDTGEQVAWVLGPDGVVRSRPVTMGAVRDADVEIVEGLEPGDRIVVAGVTFLHDGMKVRDLGSALGG
ncbi:MAG TPA: efflux RND transporter periplasmic adaptor subunit [Bryobacteraceae bacterium]